MKFQRIPFSKIPLKYVIVLIVAILLVSTYVISFNDKNKDTTVPVINNITGNTAVLVGEMVNISVNFTDNVGVTTATIYYKIAGDGNWSSMSILNGSVNIPTPSDPVRDLYYYVTVDDAAGNGPIGDPSINGSKYYTVSIIDSRNDNQNESHYVFIEEGTATTCVNCPAVSDILHELYESGKYNFYYVSMVDDRSSIAKNRLANEYNIYGFPTVFIDGGYRVIMGGNNDKSTYAKAILESEARGAPNIHVTVNAEYDNKTNELTAKILVKNNENKVYNGHLKVYLTEIISRWKRYDGKPYHYGFMDYIINEGISLEIGENKNFSKTFDVSNYDHENLMIFAVVFNSEYVTKYANPPSNSPFNAYYADAADAAEIVEGGNLPPEVGIVSPEKGRINLFGSPIFKNFGELKNTFLIGKTKISVYARDDSGIKKVEFYVDDELMKTVESEPYEWVLKISTFKEIFPHKHTISVKAYDNTGKTATESMDVWARL